jgi:hypothetical protein
MSGTALPLPPILITWVCGHSDSHVLFRHPKGETLQGGATNFPKVGEAGYLLTNLRISSLRLFFTDHPKLFRIFFEKFSFLVLVSGAFLPEVRIAEGSE